MKKHLKTNALSMLKIGMLSLSLLSAAEYTNAQTIINATNTSTAIQGSRFACPSCNTMTGLECLNADMQQIKPDPASPEVVYGYVYSGATGTQGTTPVSDQAYIFVESNYTGASNFYEELPMPNTGLWQANQNTPGTHIVHDPDIAMGHYFDQITGAHVWFAAVVYESNGDIYMEAWEYDPYTISSYSSIIPVSSVVTIPGGVVSYSGGQLYLGGNGNAKYPHIDLVVDKDDPSNIMEESVRYVVTWEESGTVINIDGDLFNVPLAPVTIADGSRPDIAGVSNYEHSRSTVTYDDDIVYTTYIDGGTDDLMLAERKFGDPTIINYVTLATAGTYEYSYPRIAGARYYDYSMTMNPDPACVVVANEYDPATPFYGVKSYTYYNAADNPGTNLSEFISDYSANGRFTTSPISNCVMPVVSGVGKYTLNKYAYVGGSSPDVFSVGFYSDYTWDNSTNAYDPSGNGDLYYSQIDMNTYQPPTTDFYEVYTGNYTSSFSMSGNKPYLAMAASANSNNDVFFAFYDGSRIRYKFTGATYSFKPTNINSIANAEVAVYPNPVTTAVTIGDGNGSNYTVTDITGKVMATGVIEGNKYTVSTENYAAGTYILQLVKDGVPSTVKFVKQ